MPPGRPLGQGRQLRCRVQAAVAVVLLALFAVLAFRRTQQSVLPYSQETAVEASSEKTTNTTRTDPRRHDGGDCGVPVPGPGTACPPTASPAAADPNALDADRKIPGSLGSSSVLPLPGIPPAPSKLGRDSVGGGPQDPSAQAVPVAEKPPESLPVNTNVPEAPVQQPQAAAPIADKPVVESATVSQTVSARCHEQPRFRFDASGRLFRWFPGKGEFEPGTALTVAWKDIVPGWSTWELGKPGADFLNQFLDQQHELLCVTPHRDQKVMLVTRQNGLGNSAFGSAAFLMAGFLSGKLVVLKGWGGFGRAFDSPLSAYTWTHLEELDRNNGRPETESRLLQPALVAASANCTASAATQCEGISGDDAWFSCERFERKFPKQITSVVGCCAHYLRMIFMNPHYNQQLVRAFGGHQLGPPVYRMLFRPSHAHVIAPMEERMRTEGQTDASGQSVGIQIRVLDSLSEWVPKYWKALIDCSVNLLKREMPKHGPSQLNVFLAAVTQKMLVEIQEGLRQEIPSLGEFLYNKPPEDEMHGGGEQYALVLQDVWRLARSDTLLLSAWSSLGSFAGGLRDGPAWEVEGGYARNTGRCRLLVSNEPCCMRNWGPGQGTCKASQGAKPITNMLTANDPPGTSGIGKEILKRNCAFDDGLTGTVAWKGFTGLLEPDENGDYPD